MPSSSREAAGEKRWSNQKVLRKGAVRSTTSSPETRRLLGRIPARQIRVRETTITNLQQIQAEIEAQLAQAKAQAEALLAQARAESEALREQARREGEAAGYQAGYDAGYEKGYAEGAAAVREEMLEQLHTVYRLADEAAKAKAALIAAAEDEIVELVIEVARKVIGEVVELNPTTVVNVVAKAIEHANTGDVLTIRVNPRDVELLREYWADALGDNPGNRRWEILADRRVKPGGCVIDTRTGSVDAQIDTQLVQIKYAFDRTKADGDSNANR